MNTILTALALLAAAQAASPPPQAGFKLVPVPARVQVTGYGEVKYMPDVATITYTARGEGTASDEAVRAMTASEARIDAALHQIDPAAEPHTSEVEVAPVRSDDCKDPDYGRPQLSTGACAVAGYVATQSVTLHTLAVNDAGTLVGLVGRAGGLNPRIESFGVRDSRPQQQLAIQAALADAASKAAAIAAQAHVQLGPVLDIDSGHRNDAQQIVVSARDVQTNNLPAAAPPVPVNLTPEPLTTNSYVTVMYEIRQ